MLFCEGDLEELIRSAQSHGISFVYALSPGLDMVLSSEEEISLLKIKMDQVGYNTVELQVHVLYKCLSALSFLERTSVRF